MHSHSVFTVIGNNNRTLWAGTDYTDALRWAQDKANGMDRSGATPHLLVEEWVGGVLNERGTTHVYAH